MSISIPVFSAANSKGIATSLIKPVINSIASPYLTNRGIRAVVPYVPGIQSLGVGFYFFDLLDSTEQMIALTTGHSPLLKPWNDWNPLHASNWLLNRIISPTALEDLGINIDAIPAAESAIHYTEKVCVFLRGALSIYHILRHFTALAPVKTSSKVDVQTRLLETFSKGTNTPPMTTPLEVLELQLDLARLRSEHADRELTLLGRITEFRSEHDALRSILKAPPAFFGPCKPGDIVIVKEFPFANSDDGAKTRPALVISNQVYGNVILAMITTAGDPKYQEIPEFEKYGLQKKSFVRPFLWTADCNAIAEVVSELPQETYQLIRENLIKEVFPAHNQP